MGGYSATEGQAAVDVAARPFVTLLSHPVGSDGVTGTVICITSLHCLAHLYEENRRRLFTLLFNFEHEAIRSHVPHTVQHTFGIDASTKH